MRISFVFLLNGSRTNDKSNVRGWVALSETKNRPFWARQRDTYPVTIKQ